MALSWIVSRTLAPVADESLGAIAPLLDEIARSPSPDSVRDQIKQLLAGQGGAPQALGFALAALNDRDVSRWFTSVANIEGLPKSADRLFGWPDLKFEKSIKPEDIKGSLTLQLDAGGGIYLSIDAAGDTAESDRVTGCSGQLTVLGGLGLGLRGGIKTDLLDGLGFSGHAEARGKERIVYAFAILQPNTPPASIAARILARASRPPSDYGATSACLNGQAADSVALRSVSLSRERSIGAGASIKVPIKIKAGTVTLSGSARFKATKKSRLEITPEGDALLVRLKGEAVEARDHALGLEIEIGLSAFGADAIRSLIHRLGDLGEAIDAADETLALAEETILKPGSALRDVITKALKENAGGKTVSGILATHLDVPEEKAIEGFAEEIVAFLDDRLDLFTFVAGKGEAALPEHIAPDASKLRSALREKLESAAVEPVLDAADKALTDGLAKLEDWLNEAAGSKNMEEALRKAGLSTDSAAERYAGLKRLLTDARTKIDELVNHLGDETELAISMAFSRQFSSSRESSAIATLRFLDTEPARQSYEGFIRSPNDALSAILESPPEGVEVSSIVRQAQRGRAVTTGWQFTILGFSAGKTLKRWDDLATKETLGGVQLASRSGIEGSATYGKKVRTLELANVFTASGKKDDALAAVAEGDGLKLRLVNEEPVDLDAEETEQFLRGLVGADAVSESQARNVVEAIRLSRAKLATGRRLGGSVQVDMHLGEALSDALYAEALKNARAVRETAATIILREDRHLRDSLGYVMHANLGAGEPGAATLLALTERQLQRYIDTEEGYRDQRPLKDRARALRSAQEMVNWMAASLHRCGQLLAAGHITKDNLLELNRAFARLDDWINPAIPFLSIDSVSARTVMLFATLSDLCVDAAGIRPPTIVSVKFGSEKAQRFM